MDSLEAQLDAILKSSQADARTTLLPQELSTLATAFLPSQPAPLRSKAYIVLSAICQQFRNASRKSIGKQDGDAATQSLHRIFGPTVTSRLSDTVEVEILTGLCFLTALFEVDWQSASSIFQEDGIVESITDAMDLFPASLQISQAVAHLFAQAAGHKACRTFISSQHQRWLEGKARQTSDSALRAGAAVALVKLSRGVGADASEPNAEQSPITRTDDEELVKLMRGLVVDGHDPAPLADAIEGLAYMSTDPNVKEILANDSSFLRRLFSLVPRRKSTTVHNPEDIAKSPLYGVTVTVLNMCSYRPRLSDEEAQFAKLRRMANTPAKSSNAAQGLESNPLDDDDHVRKRGQKLIECGVLDALTAAVRATESRAVRQTVGKVLLNLVDDTDNRGRILQAGGAKALMLIVQNTLPSLQTTSRPQSLQQIQLDASDIEPIQALAKLAITSSPIQVFGPNEGALYDAIRPFTLMLIHPSSSLLQRFEALMALTNLSSQSEEVATRIARANDLLNKVELLMLEEHTMVRRAATELICNLVGGCEEVFNKYGGEGSTASKSKLQVLIALCDVDDLQTRLAASGAVATLTSSPDACQSLLELERERHRVLPILGQLVDPTIVTAADEDGDPDDEEPEKADPGLVHRGVVCLRNIFSSVRDPASRKELATEAERLGLVRALVGVIKSSENGNAPALRPTAELIKWLLESGIEITV